MEYYSILPAPIFWTFATILALLVVGSALAFILPKIKPNKWDDLVPRMRSWWVMCFIVFGALALGRLATTLVFAFISYLALKEYMTLAPTRKEDRWVVLFSYLMIIPTYIMVYKEEYIMFLIFLPFYGFIATAVMMAFTRRTEKFLKTIGIVQLGSIACIYMLAYIPLLLCMPPEEMPASGGVGLILLLLFLTQFNDVSQYMWGKMFGRHKISPNISPNKTWEGFIGGVVSTLILFYFLAPYFLNIGLAATLFIGASLPVIGFFGDITMSAIKRDLNVKDTSRLIPGHGGVLDRVDSIIFTAPWFFHMLAFFVFDGI